MTTDRDGSIERLLRQELSANSAAPVGDCPDAETLAALAEDTLPAATRRGVEGHVADCHRCQELTAAIARAGSPVDATAGAADVPTWRRRALNWLVPAAAAATAVALWVLVPGQREPAPVEPASEQQIAVVPPALPPLTSEVITSEPLQLPAEGRADIAALERDQNVAAPAAAPQLSPLVATPPPVAAPAAPAPPAATPAERALKTETPVVGGVPAATAERRSDTLNETVAGQQDRLRAGLRARALIVTDVVSPDPRIRWRIVQGSAVQHSTDGGATWMTQQTGVPAALTAGSAPAPDVLWLIGRGGVVLRTTDRGRQWQRVPFPETVDLTAIAATSARNATVNVADGRRFVTDDGGVTWIPVR